MTSLFLSNSPARCRKARIDKQHRALAAPVGQVLQFQVGSSHNKWSDSCSDLKHNSIDSRDFLYFLIVNRLNRAGQRQLPGVQQAGDRVPCRGDFRRWLLPQARTHSSTAGGYRHRCRQQHRHFRCSSCPDCWCYWTSNIYRGTASDLRQAPAKQERSIATRPCISRLDSHQRRCWCLKCEH